MHSNISDVAHLSKQRKKEKNVTTAAELCLLTALLMSRARS
jgi:hypothetical protein